MKILGLFFTRSISVKIWQTGGLLAREIVYYQELCNSGAVDQIYWFTYGAEDQNYKNIVGEKIKIIPKPKIFVGHWGDFIYSFFLPVVQRKFLKKCSLFKTNQMDGSWTGLICKFLYGKKLIARTGYTVSKNKLTAGKNRGVYYRFIKLVEKVIYLLADVSFVTSIEQKEYLLANYQPKKIIIIPNYVDIDLFKPLNKIPENHLVFIGRLHKEKNLVNLIQAVAWSGYKLDIYGSGDLEPVLKELINSLKKGDFIKLKGSVDYQKLPEILNSYQLFVLPSFYEGLPKVLLEAMACGLCCLGTRVSGIKEIIEHNHNGYLTETDEKSLETAINFLMADKFLQKQLGNEARKTIEDKFSLEKIINLEKNVYQCLFNENFQKKILK